MGIDERKWCDEGKDKYTEHGFVYFGARLV